MRIFNRFPITENKNQTNPDIWGIIISCTWSISDRCRHWKILPQKKLLLQKRPHTVIRTVIHIVDIQSDTKHIDWYGHENHKCSWLDLITSIHIRKDIILWIYIPTWIQIFKEDINLFPSLDLQQRTTLLFCHFCAPKLDINLIIKVDASRRCNG